MDRDAKRDASAFRVLLDLSEEAKLPVDQLLAGIDVDRDSIYQPYGSSALSGHRFTVAFGNPVKVC